MRRFLNLVAMNQPPAMPSPSPMSSAVKAGWICLGLGACFFWTGIGFVFFSVGIILGVVAMATNQVKRGLILLVSSLVSLALFALIFFALIVGTVGVAAKKAVNDAKERRSHLPQRIR